MSNRNYTHERGQDETMAKEIRETAFDAAIQRIRAGHRPATVIDALRDAYRRADRLARLGEKAA